MRLESQAIKISIMVEKIRHTVDDLQWYPPLYFRMSRNENNIISPTIILWVAIQYAKKLIVGIIINNKYWIAYPYNSVLSFSSMPDLINHVAIFLEKISSII